MLSYYQDYEDIRLVRVRQQHGMLVVIFDRREKQAMLMIQSKVSTVRQIQLFTKVTLVMVW